MNDGVRRAGAADVSRIAETLARAFDDDPVATFAFPEPRRRAKGLARFFSIELRTEYVPEGEVYTNGTLTGAALWAHPGTPRPGVRALISLFPMLRYIGSRAWPMLKLLGAVESLHPREPHYYLGVLGTDPDWQGRGIGSALISPVLERCDAEGIPAYLESSKERNVAFYVRHGFEVTREVQPVRDGPRLWLMWRSPSPGRA